TFLRATYESPETVDGSSNSNNDSALGGGPGMDGVIQIQPGDRIPLIPQHMFKALADAQITRKISTDLDFVAVSSSYARGNENNQSRPDGIYYLGPGSSPGYGVVNLGARYQIHKRVQIFAQNQQSAESSLLHGRAARANGLYEPGDIHRAVIATGGRQLPTCSCHVLCSGCPIWGVGGMRFSF